jgi:hypothetical protein
MLRSGDHRVAGGPWQKESSLACTGGWCDQRALPDTRGIGQVARVGRTRRREGIHDDGQVWSQARVNHLRTA